MDTKRGNRVASVWFDENTNRIMSPIRRGDGFIYPVRFDDIETIANREFDRKDRVLLLNWEQKKLRGYSTHRYTESVPSCVFFEGGADIETLQPEVSFNYLSNKVETIRTGSSDEQDEYDVLLTFEKQRENEKCGGKITLRKVQKDT